MALISTQKLIRTVHLLEAQATDQADPDSSDRKESGVLAVDRWNHQGAIKGLIKAFAGCLRNEETTMTGAAGYFLRGIVI
jgi:hypothetical protein